MKRTMQTKARAVGMLFLAVSLTGLALASHAQACIVCMPNGSTVNVPHGCCTVQAATLTHMFNEYRVWMCNSGCLMPTASYICTTEVCTNNNP